MIAFLITVILIAGFVFLAGCLSFSVLRSLQLVKATKETHFYLPNDFFISLVLLSNFWLILLVLLGSQELLPADRQMIVIITSLLAPFLSWWRKKKVGAE